MGNNVNDMTDAFDRRLEAYERQRVPKAEIDASISVYERVKTARTICESLLGPDFSEASVIALAVEIGRVKQSGQATTLE